MPWQLDADDDGLRATDPLPYNEREVLRLVQSLENLNINKPHRMCRELREGVSKRHMSRSVILRLSTWCEFSQPRAESAARDIGNCLFGRYPQPRFCDGTTLRPGAKAQYQAWTATIVSRPEPRRRTEEPQEKPEMSLSIRRNGELLGRLRLFGAHLIWYPVGGGRGFFLEWDRFHQLMQDHGQPDE